MEPAPGPVAPDKELEEQPLSRQVFIVQELEIRDRLPSSKINKFLYLYTSERMPRRTHSNMVLWAAPRAGRDGPPVPVGAHMHTHLPGLLGAWEGGAARASSAEGIAWGSPSVSSSPSKRCTWSP